MPATFHVQGEREILQKMKEIPQRFRDKLLKRAAEPVAREIASVAKLHAPKLTGTLAAGIEVRVIHPRDKGLVIVFIETRKTGSGFAGDDFYAGFQEFGTRFMDPNPFLLPALLESEGKVLSRITREGQRAIEEEHIGDGGGVRLLRAI